MQAVTASRPAEDGRLEPVLKQTTLGVTAGEVLAIAGPSGSGKSTLLRLLNRLLDPDAGSVFFAGRDIRTIDPPELRAQLPLVAQKPFLFPGTVKDNLEVPSRLRRAPVPEMSSAQVQDLLKMCQVDPEWLGRDARKLSIGQQQRVCLVRALLGPCKALLLDEPTSALDRPTSEQMARTFRQLSREKGLAIVIVTHDIRIAEVCADQVALMFDGAVIEDGPTEKVLKDPTTVEARRFLALEVEGRNVGVS